MWTNKKRISVLITICAWFLTFGAYSLEAQVQRCHTTEYTQYLLENDQGFEMRSAEIEKEVNHLLSQGDLYRQSEDDVLFIPVVVHLVYSVPAENISDEQILSQIDVLNEDFGRTNQDASETPSAFSSIAANTNIQFRLASLDPDGNETNGITRTETSITSWDLFAPITAENFAEKVKDASTGGADIWDRDCYLNIWVCDLGNSVLGYASPPGSAASKDGVVIGYKWMGRGGSAVLPYNLGRTTTHEVGHWLGLRHVWGDDGGTCGGSDGISDTPNQSEETYGCPDGVLTDVCSPTAPGIMYMNYMDYTNDICMNLFTEGQSEKMRGVLETSRSEVVACAGIVIKDTVYTEIEAVVYPNPASDLVSFSIEPLNPENTIVAVYNMAGQKVMEAAAEGNLVVRLRISQLPQGGYLLRAWDGERAVNGRILVSR